MSSEFSCDYCSASPRNPCYSRAEAARCGNQDDPGHYLDFKPSEVATWLRSECQWRNQADDEILQKAADILDGL